MGQRIPAEGQAPVEEQAPAEGGQAGPADQLTSLLQNLTQGMQILTEVVSEAKPEMAERVQALQGEFTAVVDEVMGGGGQAEAPGQGIVSPEAGGAGASPAGPALR